MMGETMANGIPTILDARRGPVDHPCSGTWQYLGLNKGGHETYYCARHDGYIIAAHVAAGHVCNVTCSEPR